MKDEIADEDLFPLKGIERQRDGTDGDGSEADGLDLAGSGGEKREAVVEPGEVEEADQGEEANEFDTHGKS